MFCVALFFPHTENRNTENVIYEEKLPAMSVDSFFLASQIDTYVWPAYEISGMKKKKKSIGVRM